MPTIDHGTNAIVWDDEFQRTVQRFVRALRTAVEANPDPELAVFGPWQSAVLDALEDPRSITATASALRSLHEDEEGEESAHLLAMELDAFSALAKTEASPPSATSESESRKKRSWKQRLLGIGKTAADSLKDILENHLTPREKQLWVLGTEVLDVLRGAADE